MPSWKKIGFINSNTIQWTDRTFKYEDNIDVEGTHFFIYNARDPVFHKNADAPANENSLAIRIEYNGFVYTAGGDEYTRSMDRFLKDHPKLVPAHVRNTAHHLWGPVSTDFLKSTNAYLYILSTPKSIREESEAFIDDFVPTMEWLNRKKKRFMEYAITAEVRNVYIHAANDKDWGYDFYPDLKKGVIPGFP